MTKHAELPLETGLIVDEFVERFESVLDAEGSANLAEFLPPTNHKCFLEIAAELVRVELEYRQRAGEEPRLQDYRDVVPQIFDSKQHLQDVAFEEYRLRRIDGEDASTNEYRHQFDIDTAAWVNVSADTDGVRGDSTIGYGEQGILRTLDAVEEMPVVGESFGEFDLVDSLGRGTFAEVFLARQRGLANRHVALKVSASSSGEADKLARLQHTNIVPIYSLHAQQDLNGVCMPYLGATTLADVLGELKLANLNSSSERKGCAISDVVMAAKSTVDSSTNAFLSKDAPRGQQQAKAFAALTYADSVASIMASVAEGLAFAHQRGIVHRDIKPGNVLMANDGEPRLLDFNLSDDTIHDNPAHLFVGGTLPYMSPEQLRGLTSGAVSEPTSDVFSCGVMLYELLTLKNPYRVPQGSFEDVVEQMIADHSTAPASVLSHDPGLSVDFDAIIAKCLHSDPGQRYPTGAELAEDLNCHLTNRPLKHADNVSTKETIRKWTRRHPRITSATTVSAIAALCLASVLGFLMVRNGQYKVEQATNELHSFERDYSLVRTALSSPVADESIRTAAMSDGQTLLSRYWDADQNDWQEESNVSFLPVDAKQSLREQVTELEQLVQLAGDSSDWSEQADNTSNDYFKAVRALRSHDFVRARTLLDRLRDVDSSRPSLWLLSGNAMAGLGELSQADAYYSVYVGLRPDHYVGYFYRGLCRLDNKDFRGAAKDFSEVIELRPDISAGWLNRSLARVELSQLDEARADLDKAITITGVSTRAYSLRAKVRRMLGDQAGAQADHEAFMAKTPTDAEGWVEHGTALVQTSPEQSLTDFERALELDPTNRRALNNSVYVLIEVLNEREKALKILDRMLEIDSNDDGAIAARAVLSARMGRRAKALRDVDRLLKLKPSPKRIYQAASAYALTSQEAADDAALAIQNLSHAFRFDPGLMEVAKGDVDLDPIREMEEYTNLVRVVAELTQQQP